MSITDELRGWLKSLYTPNSGTLKAEGMAIADRIDKEHENAIASVMNDVLYHANDKDMAELGWIRLPKDADGEYIRIGDVVTEHEDGHTFTVHGFMEWGGEWWVFQRDAIQAPAQRCTHYYAPTIEDVLREFHDRMEELGTTDQCVGTDRAEAVDALLRERAELVAEYAEKLQLRGEGE